MRNRTKRKMSSIAFFTQKAYWRIVTAKPSAFGIAVLVVITSVFLLGGGVYNLLEQPLVAVIGAEGRIIVFYPFALNAQFLLESFVVMASYTIGVIGFLLAYQSTKYAYRPRQAFILLLIGCVLIVSAYFMNENFLVARWSGG